MIMFLEAILQRKANILEIYQSNC